METNRSKTHTRLMKYIKQYYLYQLLVETFFNLLLILLTENNFRDKGGWFHILLSLYFTVLFS